MRRCAGLFWLAGVTVTAGLLLMLPASDGRQGAEAAGSRPVEQRVALPIPTVPTRPTLVETVPATVTATVTLSPTVPISPTATSTPSPTPTPRPVNLPMLFRQLIPLVNGTFSGGSLNPGWETSGSLPVSVTSADRHSAPYAALLGDPSFDNFGGVPVGRAAISQVVDVPALGHPKLLFWYRLQSYDTVQFDYFCFEIAEYPDGNYELLVKDGCTTWEYGTRCPKNWQEVVVPLDDWRGKRVQLRFSTVMTNDDGYYNTWTYVDDIYLLHLP